MKYHTIEEIREIQRQINAREDRLRAISRLATSIAQQLPSMGKTEIYTASEQIKALREEVTELKRYIDRNKKIVQKFFAPAVA